MQKKLSLRSVVILVCLIGSAGIAFIDASQRNAFMNIAIVATGGFFGAEVPGKVVPRSKDEE